MTHELMEKEVYGLRKDLIEFGIKNKLNSQQKAFIKNPLGEKNRTSDLKRLGIKTN